MESARRAPCRRYLPQIGGVDIGGEDGAGFGKLTSLPMPPAMMRPPRRS
jgi:hypothetical protein